MLYTLEFDVLPLSLLWILTENVLDTNRLSYVNREKVAGLFDSSDNASYCKKKNSRNCLFSAVLDSLTFQTNLSLTHLHRQT